MEGQNESMTRQEASMTRQQARLANLAVAQTVEYRVDVSDYVDEDVTISWQLLDEVNASKDSCVQYRAYRRISGQWYMTVDKRESKKYGIIDAMLVRAMRYWSILEREPEYWRAEFKRTHPGRTAYYKPHLLMIDWMVQDCWELRQVASVHTFRGILALLGEVVSRDAITDALKRMGLARMYGNHMAIWIRYPDRAPGTKRPIPTPPAPEPSWLDDVCLPANGTAVFHR